MKVTEVLFFNPCTEVYGDDSYERVGCIVLDHETSCQYCKWKHQYKQCLLDQQVNLGAKLSKIRRALC